MSEAKTTLEREGLTEDGQPWGSDAYGSASAVANRAALSRHLAAVRDMPSVQRAWIHAYRALRLPPGSRVLEVGCGTGVFLPLLGELVGERGLVVGVDHGASLLVEAETLYAESGAPAPLNLLAGDAHNLPLADAMFDAAHVERVLMHLTDPDRTLRELARVVRPGGWIVVVEPDLAGWRIDHPDQQAIRMLVQAFCESWRHPAMGVELPRRMTAAGLADISAEAVTAVERDLPNDVLAYYRQALETAVQREWLSAERAERTVVELQLAAREGAFTSYSSLFVVAGRAPDR